MKLKLDITLLNDQCLMLECMISSAWTASCMRCDSQKHSAIRQLQSGSLLWLAPPSLTKVLLYAELETPIQKDRSKLCTHPESFWWIFWLHPILKSLTAYWPYRIHINKICYNTTLAKPWASVWGNKIGPCCLHMWVCPSYSNQGDFVSCFYKVLSPSTSNLASGQSVLGIE